MLRDLFSLFPAYAGVIHDWCVVFTGEFLFPAYAGVIPKRINVQSKPMPFPRIRGGDPGLSALHAVLQDFSPPTRG